MICGKNVFATRTDAINQISGTNGRKDKRASNTPVTDAYWCGDCGGWHLTSGSKNKNIVIPFGSTKQIDTSKKKHDNKPLIIRNPRNFKVK